MAGRCEAQGLRNRRFELQYHSTDRDLTDPNRRYSRSSISTPPNTTFWPAPWKFVRPLLPSRRFAVTKIAPSFVTRSNAALTHPSSACATPRFAKSPDDLVVMACGKVYDTTP